MPENLTITRNKIPRVKNYFRGPVSISYRQALSGLFRNFKFSVKNSILNSVSPDNNQAVNSLSQNLIDWWRLDIESNDNTYDINGANPFGPIAGSASQAAAKINNGYLIPANGGLQERNINEIFGFPSSSFTCCFWIKFNTTAGIDQRIFGKSNSAIASGWINGYGVLYTTTNKLFARFASASVVFDATISGVVTTGVWYLVFISLNKDTNTGFLDYYDNTGLVEQVSVGSVAYTASVGDFFAFRGIFGSGIQYVCDEPGCWNRILSSAEKTQIWNNGNGRQAPF